MGVLLSLLAALAYGTSDFIGGWASRRTSAWPVAFVASVGALVGAVVIAATVPGSPSGSDLWWGALAGVGSGTGGAFLYRGFAAGRMGVVAPISAVGSALLPVLAGVAGGERPQMVVWAGVVVAVPAIWLVSREPGDSTGLAAGILDGVLAGIGFGLLFAAMGQLEEGSGFWPLAIAQAVGVVSIAVTATALRARWVPSARGDAWGLAAGFLATLAVVAFIFATRQGLLTIAAVVTALYPAITILLAATLLREHIHRVQLLGLGLCAVAVALVASG